MKINFTKMHGLGNDFVVIDATAQSVSLSPENIRFLANRHFGVGCDQVLLVEPATLPGIDFNYRIFNADGGEVEQCGNGARCFARFVKDKLLFNKDIITVSTNTGIIRLQVEKDDQVTVNMGIPELEPEKVPFKAKNRSSSYNLDIDGEVITLSVVSIGNPHAVIQVGSCKDAPVDTLGPKIENHERFPNRVNVGFMEILSTEEVNLRVFERGAGETLACGTGACAAVVAGRLLGKLGETVKVNLPGGSLRICWTGENSSIMMTGPATTVYEGQIVL